MSEPVIDNLEDGAIRISLNGRSCTVSSHHLVEEKIVMLKRLNDHDHASASSRVSA